MRITTPSDNWTIAQNANQKILQWKIYARKVTTLTESLTGGTAFTEITEYIKEMPSISQAIELEVGQFTSDSFSLSCTNINYWLVNWFSLTSTQEIEVKVIFNMGVSAGTISTDNCIVASGFVDKMSFEMDEASDSVSFTIESYDEYANRITGKNLTLQKTRTISTNTYLVCNNIPGVYIYTVAPYMGLQTLEYKWNETDSVYEIKYNDGEFTTLDSGGSGLNNFRDENNKLLQIYIVVSELEKINAKQKFVLRNASDALPYVFYSDETISNMLTNIANELPIVSSSITAPTFSPYNSGYRLSNLENIANDIGNAMPNCIEWDATTSLLWIGIGNKLITRATGGGYGIYSHTFSENFTIKRIWTDRSSSGHIWVLLRDDNDANYFFGKHIYSTGNTTEIDSDRMPTQGDYQNDYSNFYLDSGAISYLSTNAGTAKYLNFTDEVVYNYGTIPGGFSAVKNAFCFHSLYTGFYCLTLSGSTYSLFHRSGGATVLTLPGIIYQAIVTSDTANQIIFYFTTTDAKLYKCIIDTTGTPTGSYSEVLSGVTAYGIYKSGSNIYFYGNNYKISSTYYPFAYLNTSTDVITTLSNTKLYIDNDDYKIKQNSLVYVSGVIYFITPGGRFMQFTTANTNRINGTYDTSDKSIRDCLNEFCRIYNLIYILKPNKTLVIFPRSNASGVIQTNGSASNLTIDTSTIVNVQKKLTDFGKATKVKIKSNGFTGEYNGTDYDVFDADGEKIIEIQSDLLQHSNGWTLRDMATHFFPFYNKELQVLNCDYGIIPALQYEVTDGANVDLSGTKINIYGSQSQSWNTINEDWQNLLLLYNSSSSSGIIQKQTINPDGSINLEILI